MTDRDDAQLDGLTWGDGFHAQYVEGEIFVYGPDKRFFGSLNFSHDMRAALHDLADARKRIAELEAIGHALLQADERGQGLPWQDAMQRLASALTKDKPR